MTQSGLTLQNGDLLEYLRLQRLIAAQDDDVRGNAHRLKLTHRVLGGLGLVLVAALDKWDEGHMDESGSCPAPAQG